MPDPHPTRRSGPVTLWRCPHHESVVLTIGPVSLRVAPEVLAHLIRACEEELFMSEPLPLGRAVDA